MGACGQRNEIDWSLELNNLRKIVINAGDDAMMPLLGLFYGELS
jgi:hypothetical protein